MTACHLTASQAKETMREVMIIHSFEDVGELLLVVHRIVVIPPVVLDIIFSYMVKSNIGPLC